MMNDQAQPFNPFAQIIMKSPVKEQSAQVKSALPSPSKLPEGAKVIGKYLLGKNIGEGTFGKVYLAMHLPTNEKVAVKIIDKSKIRPKDFERVVCEIRILKQTRHRHLIQLYEILQTEKSLLLITEYMPGGELFRHILKEKKIGEDQACVYFQQIISAVEYLHQNHIAHRDLKPQNILIDYDQQLKVIDFGLSTYYQKNQNLKNFCGSPCYAAPQIIQAKKTYNPLQADLWSCGVILFAMLCGYLPFCDADTTLLYRKIVNCNYKIPNFVSASARNLIETLLQKTPSKRLTLAEIKTHQWFLRVPPAPAYGINPNERLIYDLDLVRGVKQLGFLQEKIIQSLEKNEKNKETAAYFLLMKKLVKNGEKIPSYIGHDSFNCKLIQKGEDKEVDDTKSISDPISAPLVVNPPQAPFMPMEGFNDMSVPGSESVPPENWDIVDGQKEPEIRAIDEKELMNLANSILDLFLGVSSNNNRLEKIGEILQPSEISENRIQKLILEKKEAEFYDHNKEIKRKRTNLHEKTSFLGKMQQILPRIRNPSMQKIVEKKPARNSSLIFQSIDRSSLASRNERLTSLKPSQASISNVMKVNKLLPYLELPKSMIRVEIREKTKNLKKKIQSLKEKDK